VHLTDLFSFGSYNIANNTWDHDASGWGQSDFAYFSWNSGQSAVITLFTFNMATTVVEGNVPEPTSITLFILGILGFVAARRRN